MGYTRLIFNRRVVLSKIRIPFVEIMLLISLIFYAHPKDLKKIHTACQLRSMLHLCTCGHTNDLTLRHQRLNEPIRLPRLPRRLSILLPRFYGLPSDLLALYGDFQFLKQGIHSDIYANDRFCVRALALRRIRSPYLRDFSVVSAATNRPLPTVVSPPSGACHPCRLHDVSALLAAVNHPNIVRLVDLVANKTYVCLVHEFIPGVPIPEKLNQLEAAGVAFGEDVVSGIFSQMCEAVGWLHAHNFVHRDLSSHKFMLQSGEHAPMRVVLLDYTHMVQLTSDATVYVENVSGSDELLVGNAYYQAPEVSTTRTWSSASDVWALGIILYEMVFGGCMPFFARKVSEVRRATLHVQPDFGEDEVSASLKELIEGMLVKDERARASLAQVRGHLWITDVVTAIGEWKRRSSATRSLRLPSRGVGMSS